MFLEVGEHRCSPLSTTSSGNDETKCALLNSGIQVCTTKTECELLIDGSQACTTETACALEGGGDQVLPPIRVVVNYGDGSTEKVLEKEIT